jgi:DNA helicase II / ATP-dependent DNA helicase PcrA
MDAAGAVLAALDPEQREVALSARGPVCVLAGAGTGKTRAVAHRIAYAVATGVVDPARVLAVAFTTRAAGELRARLRLLGSQALPAGGLELVQARTFHAAALRQLTHFWPLTVGGPPPRVLDSKVGLVAEAARRLPLRLSVSDLRDAAGEIEWAKVTGVLPEDYPQAARKAGRTLPLEPAPLARIYGAYEKLRREQHLVDFESVLELTAAILAEHPPAAAAVRDRYRYFVVDEYQDVNPLQKLMLDAWVGDRDDVCVVGDPRQTIYSFAGATPSYLASFAAEFPGATVIRLVRNYRSSPQVVALANRLAGGPGAPHSGAEGSSALRRPAVPAPATARAAPGDLLVAQGPAGPEPEFAEYGDELEEAAAVARRAAALIRSGTPARQIAVLVRANAQTLPFEQALGRVGVPFVVKGAERFFERAGVRQAVGLLRAASRSASAARDPSGQVRAVLSGVGLTAEPPSGRGMSLERWESLEALAQFADNFFAASPGASLADLAVELTARSAAGEAPVMDGITLASLHAAKGLEWDAVFLAGLTDGALPIVYAQTDDTIEEERRLLYVGITRARTYLCLSWALARSPGSRPTRKPSRFLAEIRPRRRLDFPRPLRPLRQRAAVPTGRRSEEPKANERRGIQAPPGGPEAQGQHGAPPGGPEAQGQHGPEAQSQHSGER